MTEPINPARVSVVIPHYGEIEPTQNLIAALQAQQDAAGLEIIVADDSSPIPFPAGDGYQLVRREQNGGYGSACNSGAALASRDYLLFANSDLVIGPQFIADFCAAAAPWQPAVVAPRVVEGAGENHVPRRFPRVRQFVVEWLVPLARFEPQMWWQSAIGHDIEALTSTNAAPTDWLTGVLHLIPTADFRAVGGFDERFYMNAEETDLHLRLNRERGLPAIYLPTVEVQHASGGSSDPLRRAGWVLDSRFWYATKWGGAWRLRIGLMLASYLNFGWNLGRRLLGRASAPRRVLAEQLGLIDHAWRGRKR